VTLVKYLSALGYGTRREVTALMATQRVTTSDGGAVRDGDPWLHAALRVNGAALDPAPGAVLMLHKPIGYVCSTNDVPPLIYELLPERFQRRRPVMASIGRLDRDTSGLLLLTDDGALNHRLTSPRSHVSKTYCARLATPLRGDEAVTFASGALILSGETTPLAPARMLVINETTAELTLTEGRYHQVRRMFAAAGNHVIALHRTAVGAITLGDLPPAAWRTLTDAEQVSLSAR